MESIDHIVERLSGLGDISSRAMFGGQGIYWRDTIFAIAAEGRLYFKADDQSREDYLARGLGPFRPNQRQTLRSYYEVPPEVLAEPEALLAWAAEAIRVARPSPGPG